MMDDINKTVAAWYLFLSRLFGVKGRDVEFSPPVMFVLAQWIAFSLMSLLFAFSDHVFDLIGMYISLWPSSSSGARSLANPVSHIGLFSFICGFVISYRGFSYLTRCGAVVKYPGMSFSGFMVCLALALWPCAVLVFSIFYGGNILQCVVHILTISYFYFRRNEIKNC